MTMTTPSPRSGPRTGPRTSAASRPEPATAAPAPPVRGRRPRRPSARGRHDAAVRHASALALWAALALPTYWWAADGGLQQLGGWATGLISAGRVTGLWASVLLLAQVLLMARVPLLERAFGQDDLARVHRVVGFTSFTLMLAHIGLISWGYAGGRLPAAPTSLWALVVDAPGMLLAAAGTLALVMVVITSIRAARARLRYESWHLLHLYAYLGVGLALPHQLWTGTDLLGSPVRTAFWWTAWGAAAAAVLGWRVLTPFVRTLRSGLRVTDVVTEAPGVVSVHVAGPGVHRLRVEAGQFLTWRFLDRRGWTRANPYSLSAAPDGRSLRLTAQAVGDGSAALAHLRPGQRVAVEGPFGRLSHRARHEPHRKVALIGAGLGIAPIRSLAEGLPYAPGDAVVLHRFTEHHLFDQEWAHLARRRGLHVVPLPGRRRADGSWLGTGLGPGAPAHAHRLRDLDVVRGWVPDLLDRDVYLCGPAVWTDLVRADLLAAGLPPERLHLETFGW